MGAFLERLLEPGQSTTPSQYVDMLLNVFPLFPEFVIDQLSHTDGYSRLRFELKRRNLSNKNLAEKTGIHETAIARAFSRKTGLDKHWDKICRAVGVERDWLVDGIDDTIQSASMWPSPLLGKVTADLIAKFTPEPSCVMVSVAGFVEVESDLPQFHIKAGDRLILARSSPAPKDLAVVRRKDGSASFGRIVEQRTGEQPTDVVLSDGEGRVTVIKQSDVSEQFLVRGVLFPERVQLVKIDNTAIAQLLK